MHELKGKPAEVTLTIEVTRAKTGKVETYELVGHIVPEEDAEDGEDEQR